MSAFPLAFGLLSAWLMLAIWLAVALAKVSGCKFYCAWCIRRRHRQTFPACFLGAPRDKPGAQNVLGFDGVHGDTSAPASNVETSGAQRKQ
ncbi:hypothetical protein JG687_00018320 [Phytophthora cactorum]|uniref:Secreted protein n=1 Tax=Phytophthora cactorum TaxID=29920 RepID=A0A329S840_9STRA|nr:hypothetical protein JG687_00018320 [Phytophthora cactorum]RAW32789.1 hypothetical protein PC110_g10859 [Phytophthora cactorum]